MAEPSPKPTPAGKQPNQQPFPNRKRLSFSLHSTIILFLLSFRLLNALTVRTFFQPDEYFQSLEPAWNIVFGDGWITWEWRHGLRSILHPSVFALLYSTISKVSTFLTLSPSTTSTLLILAPKLLQAFSAAMCDWATARLAGVLWGSKVGWIALLLTTGSTWQWFCATRTFSSSMETAVTAVALSAWPWTWAAGSRGFGRERKDLRIALALAGVACLLRPTNVLIWVILGAFALWNNPQKRAVFVLEASWIGFAVLLLPPWCSPNLSGSSGLLGLNALLDHWYYGRWTFPPLTFLQQNLHHNIASFYGINDWHYYLSQGLPLLTTFYLPLTLGALYTSLRPLRASSPSFQLASTVTIVTTLYSLIAHKEVRFLFPLLPLLHALAAKAWLKTSFLSRRTKRVLLGLMIALNAVPAYYGAFVHQRGVLDVITHLRDTESAWESAGFLMPCHSTPWKSTLAMPGSEKTMWALGCEPPVDVPLEKREAYVDEADEFYQDMRGFVREVVGGRYGWPDRLVVFEGAVKELDGLLGGQRGYKECWRGWNSHWHDDGRRKGDVVVFCKGG